MTGITEHVIIVAAGSGSRFGANVPKQYCSLAGVPVLIHTLRRISSVMPNARQLLVISSDMEDLWLGLCRIHNFRSPEYVFGGATRFHSVKSALRALDGKTSDNDIVYIHDAARPLLKADVIERLRKSVVSDSAPGVVPVIPLSDSIRKLHDNGLSEAVDRDLFRAVQTPQAFRFCKIAKAYTQEYNPRFTDDASVAEHYFNQPVMMTEGSVDTLKITNSRDLAFVATLL
ncbi:MAG: 2-C-methyl-D-erythritol 4-phosphate cytidylyltransferase [Muribaculaceae bacterium]|nr:2-C-methyl-D-erythritol 4-phosphate cytidylyltransferase [Muribaculaceae bacterium]